ncbi:hypothetical protein [Marinobacter sediminicola]|uniref:hypothetical protein n=1 Tax=Marinobacter sediminicola TaxID=3072994 RepID=UPI002811AE6E|nr:hypothetical protein [Marinobacter sp. F26243]
MLRAILISGFVLGLAIVAVLGVRWLQTPDNGAVAVALPACDLLGPTCEWETGSGVWNASLQNIGDKGQGTEYQLTVSAPVAPERFIAVLRGESMYMGEYPVPLRRGDNGQYSAQFVAPLCTTGTEMVWRVDLQSGQQPLLESVPLKLIFQSEGH